jgi:peptidoglycan/xylan/chitin deacetylase (PgdA/CDA1 family)
MRGRGGIFLAQWRKDLRIFILVLLALLLWVLPWAGYGAACLQNQRSAALPAGAAERSYVALTFDDGPRRETTTLLLDGLAQRGVHATFFIVGTRVEGREDILLRMTAEGHQIGIHTQNHKVLADLTTAEMAVEVDALANTLTNLLGQREFMLRPPYGMTSNTLLKWTKRPIILWSVDPEDWADHDVERQVAAVMSKVKDGDIILLHDIYHASVETALQVVDTLLAEGYCFVTVEELFALRGMVPELGKEYRSLPVG